MTEIILQLVASFLGAMGFSLLFNVEKKHLIPCCLGGLLTWTVYLLGARLLHLPELASAALSAGACQIYAELMARALKAPATTFYIPALVPLIPGGSLYRTMDAAIGKDWVAFRHYGSSTLQVAMGIAVGLSFVAAVIHISRVSGKVGAKK